MNGPTVRVALDSEVSGYIIASVPHPGEDDLPPSQQMHMGARLVVGDVLRVDGDGDEQEAWRAWLWPLAGGDMHTTRSCEAVDAPSVARLRERIGKRAAKGAWWK